MKASPVDHLCVEPGCGVWASWGKTTADGISWYCRDHLPADYWEAANKVAPVSAGTTQAPRMGPARKQGTLL